MPSGQRRGEADRREASGQHDAAEGSGEAAEQHAHTLAAGRSAAGTAGGREARTPFGPTHRPAGCGQQEVVYGACAPSVSTLMGARPTSVNQCRLRCWLHTFRSGHSDVGPPATICTSGPRNPRSPAGRLSTAADLRKRASSQVSAPASRREDSLKNLLGLRRVVRDTPRRARPSPSGGTTTVPVAVVATTGGVKHARPRRAASAVAAPRATTSRRSPCTRRRVPDPDHLAVTSSTSPARTGPGTARRSTTRTAPRRRRCGCTPRWRRRRTGRGVGAVDQVAGVVGVAVRHVAAVRDGRADLGGQSGGHDASRR